MRWREWSAFKIYEQISPREEPYLESCYDHSTSMLNMFFPKRYFRCLVASRLRHVCARTACCGRSSRRRSSRRRVGELPKLHSRQPTAKQQKWKSSVTSSSSRSNLSDTEIKTRLQKSPLVLLRL
jgi:hypothetical protein